MARQKNGAVLDAPVSMPDHGHLSAVKASHSPHGAGRAQRFGITEANLALRRQFVRLGDAERATLESIIPWMRENAPGIAKEFYDWQFEFGPTRAYFTEHANRNGIGIDALRRALESAQSGYLISLAEGARTSWGVDYFEGRLSVGATHDRINLPFKWYVGSYSEFQGILSRRLRAHFGKHLTKALDVEAALWKVFNLDMQAVGDSFLLSTLESMGLDVEAIEKTPSTDRTE